MSIYQKANISNKTNVFKGENVSESPFMHYAVNFPIKKKTDMMYR